MVGVPIAMNAFHIFEAVPGLPTELLFAGLFAGWSEDCDSVEWV